MLETLGRGRREICQHFVYQKVETPHLFRTATMAGHEFYKDLHESLNRAPIDTLITKTAKPYFFIN